MREFQILEQLENESSKTGMIHILKAASSCQNLVDLVDAALNFDRKFFIKKFSPSEPVNIIQDKHQEFMDLLKSLESRVITGGAAQSAVELFLSNCNEMQQKWYSRVLKKDLRAGFSVSTANKAGFRIPVFDVMLAKDGKECKKLEDIVRNGIYVSPKYNGYRCIAFCDFGDVVLLSRNGVPYENFPSVISSLEQWCKSSSFIFDGEIMSDSFNDMQQSAFASKRGTVVGDVKYYVFDVISTDEWKSGKFKAPKGLRLQQLKAMFDSAEPLPNVEMVEHTLCHTVDQILAKELEYMQAGFEGAMAIPNIPYYRGRKSNRLLKFKTMQSWDCEVVGMYEGQGKYEGKLGGLNVIQENGKLCNVGGKFSDDDREWIWNNRHEVIGRICEIKYQELTPNGVMQFPIFVRWRNDK